MSVIRTTVMPPNDVPCAELLNDVKQLHEKKFPAGIPRRTDRGVFAGEVELLLGRPQLNLA
jgi:hypothetical protein